MPTPPPRSGVEHLAKCAVTPCRRFLYLRLGTVPRWRQSERLIRSTQELLWERGYVGTSPKAIQRAADAGQGSMYHHFTGKAELAKAAIERSAAELRAAAEEQLAGAGYGDRADRAAIWSATGMCSRAAGSGRLTADPDVMADPVLRAPVAETFGWLRSRLAEVIAEGKRIGRVPGVAGSGAGRRRRSPPYCRVGTCWLARPGRPNRST